MTTTVDEAGPPRADDLVARAAALRDRLWTGAAATDRDRRLDDESFAAVRDAGLFRLLVPSRYGGSATSARTFFDVTEALGRGCTSTGWLAGVLNTGNWMVAQFPERAQDEVWGANPWATCNGTLAATATASPVDGGLRVSGRWAYASGSSHSGWAVNGVPGFDPERSATDIVLMPMSELGVEDTWHVTGMRGTGSNTVVADDVFVPAHRVLPIADFAGGVGAAHAPDRIHHASYSGLFAISVLGTQVGAADAALAYVVEKAPKRAIAYTSFANQTESPTFAVDVADAATRIETARLLGRRLADELDENAAQGELPSVSARTRARLEATAAATHVREAVDLLVSAHGTSSFAEVNPLQRIWRDTAVASRHIVYHLRLTQEMHGRSMLGLDPYDISQVV